MNILEKIAISDRVESIIDRSELVYGYDSAFDNRHTWDNVGGPFDNRPTWDNWKKK
jgi:hypothetical protein